jgi:hypothetical protein
MELYKFAENRNRARILILISSADRIQRMKTTENISRLSRQNEPQFMNNLPHS